MLADSGRVCVRGRKTLKHVCAHLSCKTGRCASTITGGKRDPAYCKQPASNGLFWHRVRAGFETMIRRDLYSADMLMDQYLSILIRPFLNLLVSQHHLIHSASFSME